MKFIIHLIAYPGAGKYTIAKELCKDKQFKLFDNHIVNNVLFSLTDLSKSLPTFKDKYINKLYKTAFEYFEKIDIKENIVFTNFLENSKNDKKYLKMIKKFAKKANFLYIPILLTPNTQTLLSRVQNEERKSKLKLTNPQLAQQVYNSVLIEIKDKNKMIIDNSNLSPEQVVKIIKNNLKKYE